MNRDASLTGSLSLTRSLAHAASDLNALASRELQSLQSRFQNLQEQLKQQVE